jgi:hypothetical protein
MHGWQRLRRQGWCSPSRWHGRSRSVILPKGWLRPASRSCRLLGNVSQS